MKAMKLILSLVIFSLCFTLSAGSESKASKDTMELFTNPLSEQLNETLIHYEPLVPKSVTIIISGKFNKQKEEVMYWVIKCSFEASSNGRTYDKYYMVLATAVYATYDNGGAGAGTALQVIELPSFLHELM